MRMLLFLASLGLAACAPTPVGPVVDPPVEDTGAPPACIEEDVWGDLTCTDGEYVCTDDDLALCGADCVGLRRDDEHCGGCGNSCDGGECERGERCTRYEQGDGSRSCHGECGEEGYTCVSATARYDHYAYEEDHEVSVNCGQIPDPEDEDGWGLELLQCDCELVFE